MELAKLSMEYKQLDIQIDFNDPERGFRFESDSTTVILSFVDWTNQTRIFVFTMVYNFLYRLAEGYKQLPEAEMLEIENSVVIDTLREEFVASYEEELHHYVLSTNEGEWCEIVAGNYEIITPSLNE